MALAFAVLQTPEDALRRVAGDAEVGDLHLAEVFIEDALAARIALRIGLDVPKVSNRITEKQNVEVFAIGDVQKRLMPRILRAARRTDARIVPRCLDREKRFPFFQQFSVSRSSDELLEIRVHACDFIRSGSRYGDFRRHGRRRTGRRLLAAAKATAPA